MIEGTPGKPYGGLLAHFNIVEANMRYRREEAQQLLGPDEVLMTITNFPRYVNLQYIQTTIFIFVCPLPHRRVINSKWSQEFKMINGRLQTYYDDFLILIYSAFLYRIFYYIVWDGVVIEP